MPKGCRSVFCVLEYCFYELKLASMNALECRSSEFCSEKVLEDEFHCMRSCNLYGDLRDSESTNSISIYLPIQNLTSKQKLMYMMKNARYWLLNTPKQPLIDAENNSIMGYLCSRCTISFSWNLSPNCAWRFMQCFILCSTCDIFRALYHYWACEWWTVCL